MFGIGGGEFIVLSIIILIVIGPKQLPEVMRTVGKFVREVMKARDEFKRGIDEDENLKSMRQSYDEVKGAVTAPLEQMKAQLESEIDKATKLNSESEKKNS